jgi:hypothetical protein
MTPADRRHRERGVVMVLAAILLVVVGAFLAVSFNAGHGVAVKGELQNAVDSAALAGVRELNGTLAAISPATNFADDFAGRHVTDPATAVAPKTVEFGNWDPATKTWTKLDATVQNLYRLNAMHVVAARQDGAPGGGPLTAFFGKAFLDRESFAVNADAIAYVGSPCPEPQACNSPFVIRYGCLVRGDLRCDADYNIGLSPATVDSAGLTDMNPQDSINGNPSANSNQICQGVTTRTSATCTIGESELRTNNGTPLNSNCKGKTLCDQIKAAYPPGSTMRIPIIIYANDNDVTACNSGQYGGVATVVSTMKVKVTGVWCKNDSGRLGPCAPYATGNCIALHTECDDTSSQPGACVALGVTNTAPVLGR